MHQGEVLVRIKITGQYPVHVQALRTGPIMELVLRGAATPAAQGQVAVLAAAVAEALVAAAAVVGAIDKIQLIY